MLKFQQFLHEDACADVSTGGMGPVVTPIASDISGQTIGTMSGSGDIGIPLFKPFTKVASFSQFKKKRKKKKST